MDHRTTSEEALLLAGCRAGDEAAWRALYRSYAGDVGTFLRGMLRYSDEIDDLVQRVFLEFLSSLPRFRGESSVRTWLLRIARNLALHEIRNSSRRTHHLSAYADMARQKTADPESQLHARHRLDQIHALLGRLEPDFREVWTLRELAGCSVTEAAAVLNIPEATVRTRHYRARQRLFALLEAGGRPRLAVAPGSS